MRRTLNERQAVVLEVISKPKTQTEIREQLGLTRNTNLTATLRQLTDMNLVYCVNSQARTGRLFGLTRYGRKLRSKLLVNKNIFHDYVAPKQFDWNLYGWIVSGRQKRAILKAMKTPMPTKYIKERAQTYNPRISRMNANDILQLFVKKGIAYKTWEGNRVFLSLTKTGEALRDQLLEP